MVKFIETEHCRGRAHCRTCRSLQAGRYLRRAWGWIFDLPGGVVDFECPHGVTAEDLPEIRTIGITTKVRIGICRTCGDIDCGIKHESDCRARAILGRENFHCPQGRF